VTEVEDRSIASVIEGYGASLAFAAAAMGKAHSQEVKRARLRLADLAKRLSAK